MSPKSFQKEQHHSHHRDHLQVVPVKEEISTVMTTYNNDASPMMTPSSLKTHKDSHIIKKSSPLGVPSSTGSIPTRVTSPTGCTNKPQHQLQRGPVIIYTHSPKVIHTNPKDFMALVQKLTGMSSSEGTTSHKDQHTKAEHQQQLVNGAATNTSGHTNSNSNTNNSVSNDDNESTSVITDENCSTSNTSDVAGELNFGIGARLFDPPPAIPQGCSVPNFPFYMPSSSDLLYCNSDPCAYDYMHSGYPCNQSTSF